MRKTKAKSRREQQGLRWLHSITVSMDMNLSKLQEKVARETWCALVSEVTKSQTWLCKWTTVAITVSTSDLVQFSSVAQLCPTLCNPVNHSTPGFPVYGIYQARILEWVAISCSRDLLQSRDQTCVSCVLVLADRFFTIELPWEPFFRSVSNS